MVNGDPIAIGWSMVNGRGDSEHLMITIPIVVFKTSTLNFAF